MRRDLLFVPGRHRKRNAALVAVLLLAVFIAVHIYRWGRPVPLEFAPDGRGRWRSADGRLVEAQDLDGDGTYDRFTAGTASFARATAEGHTRLLLFCLDGVPYGVIRDLWERGHFRQFFQPVEMVSTFPSDSEAAMTALLHAPTAPGYENRFFHRKKGKVVGGVAVTLSQSAPYLKKLSYDEPGVFKGIHFIMPVKSYRADLGRFRKRFLASRNGLFIAHLSSTDALYHILPPEGVRALLLELEAVLDDLQLEARGKLRIVLFSDHGNNLAASRPAPLAESLERAGFRLRNSLDDPRSVAIPGYGLVNFAAVYARPESVEKVAAALAASEGVDLVAYHRDSLVQVRSREGEAFIEADRDGTRFRYRPVRGDPLRLRPVWEHLQRAGKADAAGFIAEQDLFAPTLAGPYPDPLFRIFEWASEARSYVANRSDLMVSLSDGYYWGSGVFQRLVWLRSTHGGLGRATTLGFAMSTIAPFPHAQRYDELLAPYLGP